MPRERRRVRYAARSSSMPGNVMLRLSSAIVALLILGMIYTRARGPRAWRWLGEEDGAAPVAVVAIRAQAGSQGTPTRPEELVIPGPTDLDERESPEVQNQFLAVGDKTALDKADMPAYWRLMRWARAQSFDELQARAAQKVPYTQFFEDPEKYRGAPVRLRLHIKRILSYDAPENSAGLETVYEIWGTTDESQTYLYSVVCPELPPGMQTGTDVSEEGVFVGYFLKVMPYEGAIKRLAAPLLIGRLRSVPRPVVVPVAQLPSWVWLACGAVVLGAAAIGWRLFAHAPQRRRIQTAEIDDEEAADWFGQTGGDGTEPAEPSNSDDHA